MRTLAIAIILSVCVGLAQAGELPRTVVAIIQSVEYVNQGTAPNHWRTVLHLGEGTLVLAGYPAPGSHWHCAKDQFKRARIEILPGNVVGSILPVEEWMVRP